MALINYANYIKVNLQKRLFLPLHLQYSGVPVQAISFVETKDE
jgi:hypothetical protein